MTKIGLSRVLAASLVLLALVLGAEASAQEQKSIGEVTEQSGAVTLMRGDTPGALVLGTAISVGDRIVTNADSRVRIKFRDGSHLAIGANSEIVVSEYLYHPSPGKLRAVLSLLFGIVRTSLAHEGANRDYEIRSRIAVASARSTDWIVEAKGERASVFVVTGKVEVVSVEPDRSVLLEAGFGVDVEQGVKPLQKKKWGEARVAGALARTEVP